MALETGILVRERRGLEEEQCCTKLNFQQSRETEDVCEEKDEGATRHLTGASLEVGLIWGRFYSHPRMRTTKLDFIYS